MPSKTTKVPKSNLKQYDAVIGQSPNTWKPGQISLVSEDRLPMGAVSVAENCMQTQDGVWSSRWGSKNYGPSYTGPVTAFSDFVKYSGGTATNGLFILDNGAMKYSTNLTSWTTIAGHTFSTANWTNALQYNNKLLLCNGVDPFSYIDLNSFAFVAFTGISTPASPTLTLGAGLAAGSYNIYYQVTASTQAGETAASTVATASVNIDRVNWFNPQSTSTISSSTNTVTLTWAQVTGALGYTVYMSDNVSGVTYELAQVGQPTSGSVTYVDYGIDQVNDFAQAPSTDTTTAPAFTWLALSDNRLWATGDPNHPNRVYFAGAAQGYQLAFNAFFGGGWVDMLPGGRQIPKFVGQFRNGQGSPMTTILMEDPSGYGSTWHCDISSDTIGNQVISVPTLVESLNTFGSGSARSVIQTNENIYFHSGGPAGIYSTGTVPTLFNVLSTNEISILVRPDFKAIPINGGTTICGIEYDRKLFYSVPYGTTTNSRIFVYDLEKQNWNTQAFTFGVNQFVRFTDNSGVLHLLTIPTNPTAGNYIVELNEEFLDDNGVAISTNLQTGLIHVTQDHMQFGYIQYTYFEFGASYGNVSITFSGTPINSPLTELSSYTIALGNTGADVGLSSFMLSQVPQSTLSYATAPTVSSSLAEKKRIFVSQLLNNWSIGISSSEVGTKWTLNQTLVYGRIIPIASPSSWIVS